MRLSISNIAWDVKHDEQVASLLEKYEFDAIDIAHSKYFSDPVSATTKDVARVKAWWRARGVDIVGMQALLFGTQGLNVFGDEENRQTMLTHLAAVCRIGGELGAKFLVFGSPKNRDRSGLSDEDTMSIANDFFGKLGDIARSNDVTMCLEPNPKDYGANFMVDSLSTRNVVRSIAHSNIKMQLDTGALAMNGEDPRDIVSQCADEIAHVHASEALLAPLNGENSIHRVAGEAIAEYLPSRIVTIEMKAAEQELTVVEDALAVAVANYRT